MHPYKIYAMESRSHTTLAKRRAFPRVSSILITGILVAFLTLISVVPAYASSPPPVMLVKPTSLTQTSTQCHFDGPPNNTFHCLVTLGENANSSGPITWSPTSSLSGVQFAPAQGTLNP